MREDLEAIQRAMTVAIADMDRSIRTMTLLRDNLAALLEQQPAPSWDGPLWSVTINGQEWVTPYNLESEYGGGWMKLRFKDRDKVVGFEEGPSLQFKRLLDNCVALNLMVPYTDLTVEQQGRVRRAK